MMPDAGTTPLHSCCSSVQTRRREIGVDLPKGSETLLIFHVLPHSSSLRRALSHSFTPFAFFFHLYGAPRPLTERLSLIP